MAARGGCLARAEERPEAASRVSLGLVPHRPHLTPAVLSRRRERLAEQVCADTWRNLRDDLKHFKLAQLPCPSGTVWQVTRTPPEAHEPVPSLNASKAPPDLKFG